LKNSPTEPPGNPWRTQGFRGPQIWETLYPGPVDMLQDRWLDVASLYLDLQVLHAVYGY